MRNYIFRRLLLLPLTVILLSIFVFGLIRLVPGSVIDARLSSGFPGTANADDRAKLEAHFGLDKPYMSNTSTGSDRCFPATSVLPG